MSHNWCWIQHLRMPMALLWCHVTPLVPALVSHVASSTVKGIIAFLRWRQSNWSAKWIFWSCNTNGTGVGLTWYWQYHQWHYYICCVKTIEMGCKMTFTSCDPTGTSISSTGYYRYSCWCHVTPLVPALVSHDVDSIINGTNALCRWRWSKWDATWHFGHVTPLVPESGPQDATSTCVGIMWHQRH